MEINKVADNLFILIRKCYNQGTDSMRKQIIDNCVEILADSLNNQTDRKALFNTYNNIKSESNNVS